MQNCFLEKVQKRQAEASGWFHPHWPPFLKDLPLRLWKSETYFKMYCWLFRMLMKDWHERIRARTAPLSYFLFLWIFLFELISQYSNILRTIRKCLNSCHLFIAICEMQILLYCNVCILANRHCNKRFNNRTLFPLYALNVSSQLLSFSWAPDSYLK